MTRDEWKEANPLRVAMKERGLTIADTAAALDVSAQSIYFWTTGGSMPGVENAQKMEEVLGVTYAELKEWKASRPEV